MTLFEALPLLRRSATTAEFLKVLEDASSKQQPPDPSSNVIPLSKARKQRNTDHD